MNARQRISGRHLNESSVILGLGFEDVLWLGLIFLAAWLVSLWYPSILRREGSVVVTLLSAILLVPIRLTFRRKIIRDWAKNRFLPNVPMNRKEK